MFENQQLFEQINGLAKTEKAVPKSKLPGYIPPFSLTCHGEPYLTDLNVQQQCSATALFNHPVGQSLLSMFAKHSKSH